MTTNKSKNVFNIAVKGNFDDCQKLVKDFFGMNNKNQKYNLAAINSINWVRIIGQIVYYFWSYFRVEKNFKSHKLRYPNWQFWKCLCRLCKQVYGLTYTKTHC